MASTAAAAAAKLTNLHTAAGLLRRFADETQLVPRPQAANSLSAFGFRPQKLKSARLGRQRRAVARPTTTTKRCDFSPNPNALARLLVAQPACKQMLIKERAPLREQLIRLPPVQSSLSWRPPGQWARSARLMILHPFASANGRGGGGGGRAEVAIKFAPGRRGGIIISATMIIIRK